MGEPIKGTVRCPCGRSLWQIRRDNKTDEPMYGICRKCGRVEKAELLKAIATAKMER